MDLESLQAVVVASSLSVSTALEIVKPYVNKSITDPEKSNIILKLLQFVFSFVVSTQLPVNEIAAYLNLGSLDSRVILIGLAGTIAVGGETVFTIFKTFQKFQKSLTPPTIGG